MIYHSKQELADSFTANKTYLGSEIISRVQQTNLRKTPSVIKKYDVLVLFSGKKKRPCIVVKVLKNAVVSIPLTSSENPHSQSVKYKCRFRGEGYFCMSYEVCTVEHAIESFAGTFEDKKALREAINQIKIFVNKL